MLYELQANSQIQIKNKWKILNFEYQTLIENPNFVLGSLEFYTRRKLN